MISESNKIEFSLVDKFRDYRSFVGVEKLLIHIFDSSKALLLSELIGEYKYWKDNNSLSYDSNSDRFCFFSSIKNIEENTGFTERQQRDYINSLMYFKVDINNIPKVLTPYVKNTTDKDGNNFDYVSVIETKQMGMPSKRYFYINATILDIIAYDGLNYKYFIQDRFKHLYNDDKSEMTYNTIHQKGANNSQNKVLNYDKVDGVVNNDKVVVNGQDFVANNTENVANIVNFDNNDLKTAKNQELTKCRVKNLQNVVSSNDNMSGQELTKSKDINLQNVMSRNDKMSVYSINNNDNNKENNNYHINHNKANIDKIRCDEIYSQFLKNINYDSLVNSKIDKNTGIKLSAELRTTTEKEIFNDFNEIIKDIIYSSENRMFLIDNTKRTRQELIDKIINLNNDDIMYLVESFKNCFSEIKNPPKYMIKMIWSCKMTINTHYINMVNNSFKTN